MDQTEQLLKSLTEAHGVPGYETEIRALLRQYMEPLGTISQDKLGSVVCTKFGDGPTVMLAGHMDEIGFMVAHVTKEGFLKFQQLGGWWDQVLLGHRVIIKTHKGDVTGVIGAKPPHLLPAEERSKVVVKKDMYIDIGASSREEVAEAGVRVGDPVVPYSEFAVLANPKTYMSKAFDNRVGCALVIDALKYFQSEPHANTIVGVQTVMEEVGSRGAVTSVRAANPDVAIVLESDIAGDVPGIEEDESSVKMGGGPSLMVFDARMIPNIKLRDLVVETAVSLNIPLQFSVMPGGATDGAAIHLHNTGVPTVVIGVPARHIHSHSSIIHRDDYDNAVRLVTAVVAKLDAATVENLTK
ncbi:MAG: M42 family metallopeptidase [Ardenticatenaceae bacterium]|nr:M42 family metallopeptidase [Ardenticatenaceae bacterium]MCB9443242.1 M42 family metallopeptidase [Ardenticatenaceae bacterium]